jgi:N6-adenosine-specific RNA methylase IME4
MGTALDLPGRITLVSLTLPKSLTYEDWTAAGKTLRKIDSGVMWWLGDWLRYGIAREWGEKYSEAVALGFDYGVARNATYVTERFDLSRRRDKLSWSHHYEVAALDPAIADGLLDQAEAAADKKWSVMELRAAVRKFQTQQRLGELVAAPLPTDDPVHVLYMDPPWRYENPPMGGGNRSIENHYPTMTLDELRELNIGACALEDALLFMWATVPKLAECLTLFEPWGFQYRTNLAWDKIDIGMGYYARNQHELLLIGKRGELPPPTPESRPSSIYREARTNHSRKPAYYAQVIDTWYPDLRKREFFSRDPTRPGWLPAWGHQAK